jgi:hypothetical protein
LAWLPKSVADTTESWGWTNTVSSALGSLKEAGEQIMQPIGQQIASAMPAPPPFQMPEVKLPDIRPFELPGMESWGFGQRQPPQQPAAAPPEGFTLGPEAQTSATVTRRQPAATSNGFSLPGPEAWGMAGSTPASARAGPVAPAPQSASAAPTDVNEYLKHAAGKAGIDPEQVLAVMGKEGPTGWGSVGTFDTGTSYGPLQLHYAGGSNPKEGMGDRFTKATGIDLRKDTSVAAHQAAVDFAMGELLKKGTWGEWYGADNAFPASAGGKGRHTPVNRVEPVQGPPTAGEPGGPATGPGSVWEPGSSAAPKFGTYTAENLTPNQFTEGQAQGLTAGEALAVCGPAAAVAFARSAGRQPTLREAKELASRLGLWDQNVGMYGPAAQVKLLDNLGISARLEEGADEAAIARDIAAGRPVTIDTPKHYYVATGYDPQTRQFEFGQSAGVLTASKGRTRYRLDELASLGMGSPRASIFFLEAK